MRKLLLILILVSTNSTYAGTTNPNTPDSKYIEFGKSFPTVVRIKNIVNCKKCKKIHEQTASAVLIKPNWAVTAAHVVANSNDNFILIDDEKYLLPYFISHENYVEENVGFHDIAILYSPKNFDAKFYTPIYRKKDETGKAITISGFGSYGTFSTGAVKIDGHRRAGHNKIDSAEKSVLICSPSVKDGFPLEFGIAPGDSGGGMFIGNELAGINSFLMTEDKKADGTYGDQSAFTRISLYAEWIDSQIQNYEIKLQNKK